MIASTFFIVNTSLLIVIVDKGKGVGVDFYLESIWHSKHIIEKIDTNPFSPLLYVNI